MTPSTVRILESSEAPIVYPSRRSYRTVGMLSVAAEDLLEHNSAARLTMFGQELNDESYAICKADMLIKGQDVANIVAGNTLSDDGHTGRPDSRRNSQSC
ncbi:N-6 DNA methylase [Paraburkholderia sp. CNPSo 3272]|nr:N-6 DNA methylase [Paraburkholderia sp. CNPSo 3272]